MNLEGRLPGVLTGRFEGGRIALADPELGGVARFDELTVDLELEPGRVEVFGSPLTEGLARGWLQGMGFSHPIDESPFEGAFSGVEIHKTASASPAR